MMTTRVQKKTLVCVLPEKAGKAVILHGKNEVQISEQHFKLVICFLLSVLSTNWLMVCQNEEPHGDIQVTRGSDWAPELTILLSSV